MYAGRTELKSGRAAPIPLRICRARDLPVVPGRLHRGSSTPGRWLVTTVSEGAEGRAVWRWGERSVSSPEGDEIEVAPGDCVQWTVPWSARDAYGRPLPPGTYKLWWWFVVDEADPAATLVTLTVTGA